MYNMATPRERRPRNSLTPDEILDAGERVAVRGFDSLTIRNVASEVGASPMALYRHFPSKEELVDAMLDRVLARIVMPPVSDDWLADLRSFAFAHARVLIEHAWAITALFNHPSPGIAATRIGEQALAILARGQIVGADAVAAFSGLLAFNYGWAGFAAPHLDAETVELALESLPSVAFPHTAAVTHELSRYAGQENYERALGMLIAGIAVSPR
jgi:AcrR family transcriptional regulator